MPPSSWRWAGPDWESHRRTDTTCWIDGVQIQAQDIRTTAERWSRILEYPVIDAIDGGIEIPLDAGCIRFTQDRDGRGDGVCAVDLIVTNVDDVIERARRAGLEAHANEFIVCGTRMVLREV